MGSQRAGHDGETELTDVKWVHGKNIYKSTTSETTDRLAVAKTVVEAHETLAEANEDNVNKFKAVIELSREELKAEEAKEVK